MSTATRRAVIAAALEFQLLDLGVTADGELDEIFEAVRKKLAPDWPRQKFELTIADVKRGAETTLQVYVLLDARSAAHAVSDALAEETAP
jgi:hypothetical protein